MGREEVADGGVESDAVAGDAAAGGRRTGRRRGENTSRQAILEAARRQFAEFGYDMTTIRGIAREAKVDPALVHHFYLSKDGVFEAAVRDGLPPTFLPEVWDRGSDGVGEQLVRGFLDLWEDAETQRPLLAILRSAVSHPGSAQRVREIISAVIADAGAMSEPRAEAETRASLVASQLVGLAVMRYVVRSGPLASMDASSVIDLIAPTLQRYMTADLRAPGQKP